MAGKHQARAHSTGEAKGESSSRAITRVALMGKGIKRLREPSTESAAMGGIGQGDLGRTTEGSILIQAIESLNALAELHLLSL